MKKLFLCLFILLFMMRVNALEIAKNAKTAILVEATTGKILYEKDKDNKRSPASMTKIMTLLLVMEKLEDGSIKLDDKIKISNHASSMGGTQIFVEEGSLVDLQTLIKGVGIASANDVVDTKKKLVNGLHLDGKKCLQIKMICDTIKI